MKRIKPFKVTTVIYKNLNKLISYFRKSFFDFLIRLIIQGGLLSSNVTVSCGMKFRIILRTVSLKSILVCLYQHHEMLFPSQNWQLRVEYSRSSLVWSVTPLFYREVDK